MYFIIIGFLNFVKNCKNNIYLLILQKEGITLKRLSIIVCLFLLIPILLSCEEMADDMSDTETFESELLKSSMNRRIVSGIIPFQHVRSVLNAYLEILIYRIMFLII